MIFEAGDNIEASLSDPRRDRVKRGGGSDCPDRLFIRSQVRSSVARTLARLKVEVEELAEASSSAGGPRSI